MKSKLSVFDVDYKPWPHVVTNIKLFFKSIKNAWQRATKGYCDSDIWNLDYYYSDLIADTLKEYRENTISYPMYLDGAECPSLEEWKSRVYYVESLFRDSMREYENPYEYYIDNMEMSFEDGKIVLTNKLGSQEELKGLEQSWLEEEEKIEKTKQELLQTGLAELGKIYENLWY